MPDTKDHILGGLWGLLVGDAVGVPYEFKRPGEIPEFGAIEMIPPRGFDRSHSSVPVGTWSDDGAQALCLLDSLRPDDPPSGSGSGYVVDCLRSARLALDQSSYRDVVRKAISLGRDTDTTACVAGGLAGLRHGLSGIPSDWIDGMRGRDLADPLFDRFLARVLV